MSGSDCKTLIDKQFMEWYGDTEAFERSPEFVSISLDELEGEPEQVVDLSHVWGHICKLFQIHDRTAGYEVEDA